MLSLIVLYLVSCHEEQTYDRFTVFISGPISGNPKTSGLYSVGNITDVTWSSSDETVLTVISSEGSSARVNFLKAGTARLMAVSGDLKGYLELTVSKAVASVEVSFAGTGVLKNGDMDTVWFDFDAPLTSIPVLTLNGINDTDSSGFYVEGKERRRPFNSEGEVLSLLKATNATLYYALYTAGVGNGVPEARLEKVTVTDQYGGNVADSVYVQLHRVDNILPIGEVKFSKKVVKDSTKVTVTATFNEAMRPTMITKSDTLIFVNIAGGGVLAVRDTLKPTDDPRVWILDYIPNGGGDGTIIATVDKTSLVDLGGNTLNDAVIPLTAEAKADNTAPVAVGTVTDAGDHIVKIVTEGLWIFQEVIADAPEGATADEIKKIEKAKKAAIPKSIDDFSSDNKGNRTWVGTPGEYNVYFIDKDEVGNASEIVSEPVFTLE